MTARLPRLIADGEEIQLSGSNRPELGTRAYQYFYFGQRAYRLAGFIQEIPFWDCFFVLSSNKAVLSTYKVILSIYKIVLSTYKANLSTYKSILYTCKVNLSTYKRNLYAYKMILSTYKNILSVSKMILYANKMILFIDKIVLSAANAALPMVFVVLLTVLAISTPGIGADTIFLNLATIISML
jgi:hypothetical protein